MSPLLASLLLVSASLCRGEKATFPQNIEIDLVFPRNNTAYAPTNYFPLVFAVQNAGTAWPIGLQVSGEVRVAGGDFDSDSFNLGGEPNGFTSGNATADPSLLTHAIGSVIKNDTESHFFLIWSYYLENTCSDEGRVYGSGPMSISFSTSLGGVAPDVAVAVESCPSQFGLVEVDRRTSNTSFIGLDRKRCTSDLFSKKGTGAGDPCGLKPLAQTIAANVSRAMCVAENGTTACESTAGLRLMHPGLSVSSLPVLVVTIWVLWLSL